MDSTGFNNPQSVIGGYYFNIANTHFLPNQNWEELMPEYCEIQRPLTERPEKIPLLTCLDTCNFVTFWSDEITQVGIWAILRFSDGFLSPYVNLAAFSVDIGFYGYNFSLQMLYNLANAQAGGTLPPIETLVLVLVKTTPEQQGFKYLQYAYDHQICCQMCTTTLIYLNGLGAFESMAVQCEADEYKLAVETYCNRRDCDNETVNRGSIYGSSSDIVPNYAAVAGKWVSSKSFEREITIKTLPIMARSNPTGSSNSYSNSVESYIAAMITKPKDHWLMINGVPHKFVMKSSDYESGAKCWTMKGTISMSYNII